MAQQRYYASTAKQASLAAPVDSISTSITLDLVTGFPSDFPYTLAIDPDTNKEELVLVNSASGTILSVTRHQDGTVAVAHTLGAVVRHVASGQDFNEFSAHVGSSLTPTKAGVHGVSSDVVGKDDVQTLTNKTLTAPVINNPTISGAGVDSAIVFEGTTADAYETTLTVVDPTADRTLTLPNASGTIGVHGVSTLNDLLAPTSALSMGSQRVTSVATPSSGNDATNKTYVDSILGSATAASISAASAATSATSAATSATAAATSATSAATSATSAATSASQAATSASSASTSATSAATSATAAATSATSAANSATAAAASVSTIASYATDASTSASSAATSVTSAATSASQAATSATSAATSATAAATSATAAATSASSAAVSASSAATSATSAATSASSAAAVLSAAILKTIIDAKGDLIVGDGADSSVRVGVGTDGYVLTASAAAAAGVTWSSIPTEIPTQSGHTGQYLKTDGSSVSWATVDALPTQSGHSGQYLTTDGSTASWASVTTDPNPNIFMMMGA